MAIFLLTFLAAGLSVFYVHINSDLGNLVKPSDDVSWYQDNEAFKRHFPQLQQTAIVVVSGFDYSAVTELTHEIKSALQMSGHFEWIWAPGIDEFLARKRIYFLSQEQLADWIRGAQYNFSIAYRLIEDISYANVALMVADQLNIKTSLPLSLKSIMASLDDDAPKISLAHQLVPTEKTYYQLVMVKGEQVFDQRLPNTDVVANLREVLKPYRTDARGQIRLTGEVVLAHEEIATAIEGISLTGVLSLVLLLIILGFGVRSWKLIGYIFLMLCVGLLLTSGLAVLTVGTYNTLALIFVVMFFGLGVDFAIHFTLRVREAGTAVEPAIQTATRGIGSALSLCMLTSAIAFLAFYPTDYQGLAELGIISAGGMLIAFWLSLTLLPALFAEYGVPKATSKLHIKFARSIPTPLILTIVVALSTLAAVYGRQLNFDYSVLAIRNVDTEAMSTLLELQNAGIMTDYSIFVIAPSDTTALAIANRLKSLPQVAKVGLPMDLVPSDQMKKQVQLAALKALYATLFEDVAVVEPLVLEDTLDYLATSIAQATAKQIVADKKIAQARNFLQSLKRHTANIDSANEKLKLSFTAALTHLNAMLQESAFTFTDLPESLRGTFISSEGGHLIRIQPATALSSKDKTEAFIHAVLPYVNNIAGRSVVEWGVGTIVFDAFKQAIGLALMMISFILIIYFRGIILPLMVLLPIGLSLLFTAALCQYFAITLNMANILVMPLIIGLGVDTGIHVIDRFNQHQREKDHIKNTSPITMLLNSSTSKAVLISGLTTIGAFFPLSFSPHKGAASVGLLLTISLSCLIIVTFVFLPALLSLQQRFKSST